MRRALARGQNSAAAVRSPLSSADGPCPLPHTHTPNYQQTRAQRVVCVAVHSSWGAFLEAFAAAPAPKRLVAFTVYGSTYYAGPEFEYQRGDWLLFGAETTGLPPRAHEDILQSGGALVKVPILSQDHVRSLNLATTAGIGVFEALRQLAPHDVAPRDDSGLKPTVMAQWRAEQQQQKQQQQQQQQQQVVEQAQT